MNFLGHLFLAAEHQHSLLGSILPDLCKPPVWRNLSADVLAGCLMHQQVDRHTDRHPAFMALKDTLSQERRRFAGIILDVTLDHHLAKHWHHWHPLPLRQFVDDCYAQLRADMVQAPPEAQRVIQHMIRHDWLFHYQHVSGIASAFSGLSRRFRYQNPLAGSEQEWLGNSSLWSPAFDCILRDLKAQDYARLAQD